MSSVLSYLKSSILSKVVMAVTGFMLVGYIVVHTAGNLLIYAGKDEINQYSQFLHSLGPLLWIFRIVLLVALILHIWTSVKLKFDNLDAKPRKYAIRKYVKAKLTSRTMIWTGILIFCFVTYHVAHLTLHLTYPGEVNPQVYIPHNTVVSQDVSNCIHFQRTDVFSMLVLGFKEWYISLIYIIGIIIVSFHLNHAIQSMFQTLGLNSPSYFPCIQKTSVWLSIIIALCLISIPVTIMLGLVGGNL